MLKRQKPKSKRVVTRIATVWAAIVFMGAVVAFINPVDQIEVEQTILRSSCILAMLVCIELWRIETSKGKPVTLNLAIVFGFTGVMIFLGETAAVVILIDAPFAGFYVNQYVNAIYNIILLHFSLFLLIHTLTTSNLSRKYLIAGTLSTLAGMAFYYPIIDNPKFAYLVPEVVDFISIEKKRSELVEKGTFEPNAEMISEKMIFRRWKGDREIGELTREESLERVRRILPYTKGSNYINLVHAPLRLIALKMNLLTICVVIFLIIMNLVRDPPIGAYIDKLEIAFFLYLVFETIHGYVIQDIVDWGVFLRIDGIGKIVTTLLVFLLAFVEYRRYKFLSAGYGRYYESVLTKNPRSITRWRDGLDNMVLGQFFKPNLIIRRFFQNIHHGSAINRKNSEKTLDKET